VTLALAVRSERPAFCERRRCRKALTKDQVRRGGRYCSKACHRIVQNGQPSAVRQAWIERLNIRKRAGYFKRVVRAVLEDFRAYVDQDWRVPLRHAVRVVLKHRRGGYSRGWAARDARARRAMTKAS
jgi:hypothetical protein